MSTTHSSKSAPEQHQGPGVVSTGWLAANSTFEHRDERKFGPAVLASFAFHGGLLFLAILALSFQPEAREVPVPPVKYDIVFLEQPGPGGGGGGSPEPAPPKAVEIPEVTPPEPVVIPEVVPEIPPPPIPVLVAPVQTNAANVIQASGQSTVSLASYGGGGSGGGVGEGKGNGVGPGEGGGFGGGAYAPGNGVAFPRVTKEVRPIYTSEGMRAKVQGEVEIEAVVLTDGRVGDVRVVKSLDRQFGLDEEALKAARQWTFTPCTRAGQAVSCKITIVLEFRIH
jgi:protein TonB